MGSTQSELKSYLQGSPVKDRLVGLMAQSQREGRGRGVSKWHDIPGKSLLMSVYLPWPWSFATPFDVNRWICVQLSHALPEGTSFKWPNDLMLGDKKLGGLLIENHWNSQGIYASIVGIGINVVSDDGAHERAAFFNEAIETSIEPKQLALQLLQLFQAGLLAPPPQVDAMRKQYYQLLWGRSDWKCYEDAAGQFSAQVQHITPEGALVLKPKEGPSRVYQLDEVKLSEAPCQ